MDQPTVSLWVKMEPFLVGALQIPPSTKFSVHYLRKMSTYVRMRASEGYYPFLSWPMWRHIACGKLQLEKDLAWLYFELFDSLVERTPEKRLEWAEVISSCATEEETEKQKNKLTVDTLQFLLFLYIQQLNKFSLRTSLIGEEWPSSRSKLCSLNGESTSQIKNWNDSYHEAFVQNHLQDLLELLLDPDQLSASSHSTHGSLVSPEAVRALSFLIEGCVNKNRTVYPLHELALWQPLHSKSGFSKISKAFSFPKLASWLRACLTGNPFGTSACLKSGKKLAWAQQVEGTTKRAKIACNTHMVPSTHRIVVMSQVYKQTLAKSSDTLENSHVRIHRCCESFIYLLSPLRSVTIEKCRNSTFVLGPVKTVVHLHSCDNIKVIAVCHRLSLSTTTSCTFHVLTPTRPLILLGDTTEIPGGLPLAYQKALNQREQRIQVWQKTVKEAGLTKDQRKTFQMLVESKFHEWLVHTGSQQQLDSLVLPTTASKQATG
ncbi:TBCC domain-containing protein 1 isoform X2 [Tiliqua scincoides]|uniref:TBCC domain-containing protein 1 isoform X2 n=1 Tax=Tiliqua scincoides TaxID=71010 RepID=UPI003462ABC8